jgi:hypothetical protein
MASSKCWSLAAVRWQCLVRATLNRIELLCKPPALQTISIAMDRGMMHSTNLTPASDPPPPPDLPDTLSRCSARTEVVLHKGVSLSHSQGDAFCKATHGPSAGLAIGRPDVLATAAQLVRDAQVGSYVG